MESLVGCVAAGPNELQFLTQHLVDKIPKLFLRKAPDVVPLRAE